MKEIGVVMHLSPIQEGRDRQLVEGCPTMITASWELVAARVTETAAMSREDVGMVLTSGSELLRAADRIKRFHNENREGACCRLHGGSSVGIGMGCKGDPSRFG